MKIYCPAEDWTCPYFDKKTWVCTIDNPMEECDEYYYYNGDEDC